MCFLSLEDGECTIRGNKLIQSAVYGPNRGDTYMQTPGSVVPGVNIDCMGGGARREIGRDCIYFKRIIFLTSDCMPAAVITSSR